MRKGLKEQGRAGMGGAGGLAQGWLEGPETGGFGGRAWAVTYLPLCHHGPGAWDAAVVSSWNPGMLGEGCFSGVWPPVQSGQSSAMDHDPPSLLSSGALSVPPSLGSQSTEQAGIDQQLLLAIVGSVSVTCLTILFALLALFLIKKNFFHRRRTFTYQSGSVSAACPSRTVSPAPHVLARSRPRSVASSPDASRPHFHTERVRSPPLPMAPALPGLLGGQRGARCP